MPVLSVRPAASETQSLMLAAPSTWRRLIQIFSACPFLNSILGSSVALSDLSWPPSSTTQLAVWGGTQNLCVLRLVMAAMIEARVICSVIEQRASPKPQVRLGWSPSFSVDLAQVLLSAHLRSSPEGFLSSRMLHSRRSQASIACASPFCSSSACNGAAAATSEHGCEQECAARRRREEARCHRAQVSGEIAAHHIGPVCRQ